MQLRLVLVKAPFFDDAHLLVAADCVPFAYPDLHDTLLAGRSLVVGCPKFADKCREIISAAHQKPQKG